MIMFTRANIVLVRVLSKQEMRTEYILVQDTEKSIEWLKSGATINDPCWLGKSLEILDKEHDEPIVAKYPESRCILCQTISR